MDDWLFRILLFLHVFGAILAFGPTYAFTILGPMSAAEPAHGNFALRFQKAVSTRMIAPFAVLQGVTGVLLVAVIGFELFQRGWLIVSIVLYLITLAIGFGVLIPSVRKLVEATSGPPPAPPAGAAPSGPPPHIAATIRRARMGGMVNGLLVLVIVFLMVTKPF